MFLMKSIYAIVWSLESLADGCPRLGESGLLTPTKVTSKSDKGAVRCCSKDGQTCITPNSCMTRTFAIAQAECSAIGRRICTADELKSNKCCRTGCGFDDKLTWHTDSAKSYAPSGEFKVPYFLDIHICFKNCQIDFRLNF